MREQIEQFLIQIAIKVAKTGKGCLLVIEENPIAYQPLLPQDIQPFFIFDNARRIEALAIVDGACIVDIDGFLRAYSVSILNSQAFVGYGTRHAAGYTASLNNNTSILASEEDRKVRIFKNGILIMQIDALERGIENKTSDMVNILESVGVGTISSIGVAALAPTLGIALIPGIILFGSAHYMIKFLRDRYKAPQESQHSWKQDYKEKKQKREDAPILTRLLSDFY